MDILLDVVSVDVRPGYHLELQFENGERRIFDMSPYMHKKPFNRLKDSRVFNCAYVDYGTVVWPGNIDIAPETLYDHSRLIRDAERSPLYTSLPDIRHSGRECRNPGPGMVAPAHIPVPGFRQSMAE